MLAGWQFFCKYNNLDETISIHALKWCHNGRGGASNHRVIIWYKCLHANRWFVGFLWWSGIWWEIIRHFIIHHFLHRFIPWSLWRHQKETFSSLLDFVSGNLPVTGGFPSKRPMTHSFDVSFDLHLNKRLSKQSRRRWFETPSHSLWRHSNGLFISSALDVK